jgi:hypothetical protein
MLHNMLSFYGKEELALCLTLRWEGNPLSSVGDSLFSIFAFALHIWRPSPCDRNPSKMVLEMDSAV